MALPDTIGLKAGATKTWKASAGDYVITLTSLANDAGYQGAKGDLGANWAARWNVLFATSVASAASDGSPVELYWCQSTNATAGTDNPGDLAGAAGSVSNPDQVKRQLTFVGPLYLSAAVTTSIQKQRFDLYPACRYGFPVVVNKSGVALGGTAGDHAITLTEARDEVID